MTWLLSIGICLFLIGMICIIVTALIWVFKPDVQIMSRVKVINGEWMIWGVIDDKRFQAQGSGTVWHFYPSGKRCSMALESRICNEMKRMDLL